MITFMISKRLLSAILSVSIALPVAAQASEASSDGQPVLGGLVGITRAPGGVPLTSVKVVVHGVGENIERTVVSGGDGAFHADGLKPGQYQVTANKDGFASSPLTTVEVAAGPSV